MSTWVARLSLRRFVLEFGRTLSVLSEIMQYLLPRTVVRLPALFCLCAGGNADEWCWLGVR